MSLFWYRMIAIIVANGVAYLSVFFVERSMPELKGGLWGLYSTVMMVGFSFFFRDIPLIWVSPLFLISAGHLLWSVRKRSSQASCRGGAETLKESD